ncbi:mycothiol transferase [Nocardioides sp. Leaf307]|uniref:mycothiol transferase n=1 Tax=Nocardioides sp. Leaf307 TaxID=1736331 RepID=UPI0007029976|nr:DUF664 domain-containing protein [Nocardioides sp. Leaf307]KQQ39416.1 hypothetical protein ASF50_15875 [Nocardioides sp. Leaf307]
MTPAQLLTDAFERILEAGTAAVDGLDADQLAHRPGADANPIGWLVWHAARVQDDHVAGVADLEQVWTAQGFARRFDLPYDDAAIGYGQSGEEVGALRTEADLLVEYLRAVHTQTTAYVATLGAEDLDRVVDEHWDPPVTLAVRLVSVVNDDLQHVGQAAYVRGLLGA